MAPGLGVPFRQLVLFILIGELEVDDVVDVERSTRSSGRKYMNTAQLSKMPASVSPSRSVIVTHIRSPEAHPRFGRFMLHISFT